MYMRSQHQLTRKFTLYHQIKHKQDPEYCLLPRREIFVVTSFHFVVISRRSKYRSGEMKHEMTLFHTMGPTKSCIPDTPYFYGPYMVLCRHKIT